MWFDVIRCDLDCFVMFIRLSFSFDTAGAMTLYIGRACMEPQQLPYHRIDRFIWLPWSLVSGRVLIKAHRSAASSWPAASMTFAPGLSDFSGEWEILDDFCPRKLGIRIGIETNNSHLLKHRFWIQRIQLTCELPLVVHGKPEKFPEDESNRSKTCWTPIRTPLGARRPKARFSVFFSTKFGCDSMPYCIICFHCLRPAYFSQNIEP